MTTIINNTRPTNRNNGMGFLFGVIALILFAVLLFYYVLPLFQNSVTPVTVQVPEKVNVDVQTSDENN